MIDRKQFFDAVRNAPFKGLGVSQVAGMGAILDEWDRRKLTDLRWLAYMLATVFHETARTMRPIREYGRGKGKKYGTVYYGRGYVQLTWEENYRKASAIVGVDLVAHPDRALEPAIAATIMYDGMIKGWFTGAKLSDYFGVATDFVSARRIINVMDQAKTIAGYAESFWAALVADAPTPVPHAPSVEPVQPLTPFPLPPDIPAAETLPVPSLASSRMGFWAAVWALFGWK